MSEASSSGAKRLKLESVSCVKTLPKRINLTHIITNTLTEEDTLGFCQRLGLIPKSICCPICNKELHMLTDRTKKKIQYFFKCGTKSCKYKVSARKNTWFDNKKISLRKTLVLTYLYLIKASNELASSETSGSEWGDTDITSKETIRDLYNNCREVCVETICRSSEIKKIGGPGLTVEIDESKFGRRRYEGGHLIEGQWIFGGICRESKEYFLVPIHDRTADTLIPIIRERIVPGTTIVSDCWESSSSLTEYKFEHQTVDHSVNFVDPTSGAHTNNIEKTWWCFKKALPSTHKSVKKNYAAHLCEFMWRRKNFGAECIFQAFLKDVKQLYPGLN